MCDTQIIRTPHATFFAKNSDREASEPQHILRIPPVQSKDRHLDTTYLRIPQTEKRFGMILSKPSWIWGAEIGINDQGVVIGNEAVFTKLVDQKGSALLGMDLLRLGLERASCADEALSVITRLLDEHGQGGPAGFQNKRFRYDNSFIIADHKKAWILETAGQWWAAKQVEARGAISNCLSIGSDYDLAKKGLEDFARKNGFIRRLQTFHFAKAFDTFWMPKLGAAHSRRALSLRSLKQMNSLHRITLTDMFSSLRQHHADRGDFRHHSNHDVCMHAGSLLRPSQTCSSMVSRLNTSGTSETWMTGTSAPCLSLFKAVDFEYDHPLITDYQEHKPSLWARFEPVHRKALQDASFREELRAARDLIEQKMLQLSEENKSATAQTDRLARQWHEEWEKRASEKPPEFSAYRFYDRFWQNA